MKKRKKLPPGGRNRHRVRKAYDERRLDMEDLLELDEEEDFAREDAELIEDEPEEEEAPIEDLAESLAGELWDRAEIGETLTDTSEMPEEELLTEDEVRDYTQEFARIPEDIADLEAGDPAPEEYDAFEEDDFDGEEDLGDEGYAETAGDGRAKNGRKKGAAGKRRPVAVKRRHRRDRAGSHKKRDEEDGKPKLTAFEWTAVAMSIVLAASAIVLIVLFSRVQQRNAELMAFQDIGTDLSELRIIGESGLIAMRDAAALRFSEEEQEELFPEVPAEPEEPEEEEETAEIIDVTMTLTTIKSDLKVKFTNKGTGKLIASVPFSATVKDPSGREDTWTDDDMDGVIYRKDLAAGKWSVAMNPLDEKYADRYIVNTDAQKATVKSTIEYKKVDVSDEIRKESQVNVAVEDTEPKQAAAVESVNTDTVEWVESYVEGGGDGGEDYTYTEIDKGLIAAPSQTAHLIYSRIVLLSENTTPGTENPAVGDTENGTETENSSDTENKSDTDNTTATETVEETERSLSIAESTLELGVGEKKKLTLTRTGLDNVTILWAVSDTKVVDVLDGEVTGKAAGSATVTALTYADNGSTYTASCEVTVRDETVENVEEEDEKPKESGIKVSPTSVSLIVGSSSKLTVKTEGLTDTSVRFLSSDTEIVTVSEDGNITGINPGQATVTVTSEEDIGISATVKVRVSKPESAKLLTTNGEPVYIRQEDGVYREATAEDYDTREHFYLKTAVTGKIYHGWQTLDGYTYYYDKNGNYVTGDQVILGVKYTFSSQGVLSGGSGTLGIDVSKWNGNIDWAEVKRSGVSYAIIRCGFRGTSTGVLVEDSKFRSNMQGALNAGLKVGAYFFSAAVSDVEAVEEASMAASLCSGYRLSYPVFLDVERSDSGNGRADSLSASARTAVIRAFCSTMANSGYSTGLYANKNWLEERIDTPSLSNFKLWLAQYSATPSYSRTRYDMWQYTSRGTIGGISGTVDLNLSYLNY